MRCCPRYQIVENISEIEEEQVLEYGISNGEVTVEGISPERLEAKELVSCLNEYGAESCHLFDIVEDWLEERYTLMC